MTDDVCATIGCKRPPRMGLVTTRPKRDQLKTVIYFDDRTAPKTASRHCKHGAELVRDLVSTLVETDD
jgi:hypothetical protein